MAYSRTMGELRTSAIRGALRIFGCAVLAGLAMALLGFGMSLLIPVDPIRLHAGMIVAVLTWAVIGLVYSGRFLWWSSRLPRDTSGQKE